MLGNPTQHGWGLHLCSLVSRGEDGPLTQKGVPQGVLGSLLAAGPEMALGISDLEAGLLPDGGGGGIWGKPKFPQVAASPVGKEVVGDGDCQRTGPSGAGWGLVGGPFCPGSPPGQRNLPCPAYFFPLIRPETGAGGVQLKARGQGRTLLPSSFMTTVTDIHGCAFRKEDREGQGRTRASNPRTPAPWTRVL